MNLLLAAVALAAQSPNTQGGSWELVNRSDQHTTHLDVGSIRTDGDVRSAWTRSDYNQPTQTGAWQTYFLQDADCRRRTLVMARFVNYDRDGRLIAQDTIPAERRQTINVRAGSQGETLLNMMCR